MKKLFTFFFFILITFLNGKAQDSIPAFDIGTKSMRFPHPYQLWKVQTGLGFSMVRLPRDWVETALQAPLVNLHLTFGMPLGFSLEGDVTTLIVSNQVMLGPRWNFLYRFFSFNLGYDVAYSIGTLNQAGFHNTGMMVSSYPNLSIGFKTKELAFTLKGECVILNWGTMKTGENEVSHSSNYFDGVTGAIYLEQRIFRKKVFVIGFKDSYVKFYWPAWMVFTTFNRYYHIPELYFNWVL
ncbi:MAG TPA: hypothetical protein VMC08_08840 [Bacteroidales bacterium]|nr:hypothetical protein [Bacteroidales bacterium]